MMREKQFSISAITGMFVKRSDCNLIADTILFFFKMCYFCSDAAFNPLNNWQLKAPIKCSGVKRTMFKFISLYYKVN